MMYLVGILLAFASFLGLVMELYKKSLRKDKAGDVEIKGVALCCSALLGFVTFRILAGTGLDGGLNPSGYLVVLYTITIYLLQLPACMAFWKPLLKRFMERKADGNNNADPSAHHTGPGRNHQIPGKENKGPQTGGPGSPGYGQAQNKGDGQNQ